MGIEGIYLNIIKAIYDKPTASIILNSQKLQAFPLRIGKKTGMATFTSLIQHSTGITIHSNQTRRRNKRGVQIGKEEVKLFLFASDMTL